MAYNTDKEPELKLLDGTKLKKVNDFKYLGSWVDSTEEDTRIKRCHAWAVANKMKKNGNQISQGTSRNVSSWQLWNQFSCMDRKPGKIYQKSGKAIEWLLHWTANGVQYSLERARD